MIDDKSPPGSWQDHANFMAARSKLKPEMADIAEELVRLRQENSLYEDSLANYEQRCAEMEAERDRLREALERIATAGGYDATDLENMARAALQEDA
jgi:predicted nuclease with TOPRIM domain